MKPDYIIVGAGSAGCVLANRLSANPSINVLLLEAGGSDRSLLYKMPAGFFILMQQGKGNWNYESVPQAGLDGRKMYFPRGKVLGGSSAINGMVVSRGNKGDYDHWAELGNESWSYDECLPYFKKLESYPGGNPQYRGHDGPIGVTRSLLETMNPSSKAWIDGGVQAGYPFNEDVNEPNPFGVAQMQGNYVNGARQSASYCYLKPVLKRPNLEVISNAQVTKVIIENGQAKGVEYQRKGKKYQVNVKREVLLAGGVVNSPQLLQLSGIGAAEDIVPHGITLVHELSGVGKNLKDHLSIAVKQRSSKPNSLLSSLKPLAMAKATCQYFISKSGPITVSALESWAHLKSKGDLPYPDIQIYAVPLMYNDHGRDVIQEEGFMGVLNGIQPLSVGTIKIQSSNPFDEPEIDPQYLSHRNDIKVMREGIRQTRGIFAQKAYDDFRGTEYAPGDDAITDEALDTYIRSQANTLYHPVGTCKMGVDDMAVVDNQLRVKGVKGLRVIDASIMPEIISGNTNFPVMMIAEKAADMIIKAT